VATLLPEELSRPKERLEDWPTMTSPGFGKPVSRQWPLVSTSAGSLSAEFGKRMTEPGQLLSGTVPAKAAAWIVAVLEAVLALTVVLALTAVSADRGSAADGAAPAPAITTAKSAATRGFLMWGSPLDERAMTWPAEGFQADSGFVMRIVS